jgi:uncharacterized membrane protein YhaH (DUF805 family)
VLLTIAVGFVAALIDIGLFGFNPYTGTANSYVIAIVASLAVLAPTFAVASRRAHDFGQSGWLAILMVVPWINFVAALVFVFIPGQAGSNQYGADPKAG